MVAIKVVFEYDEKTFMWDPLVYGATSVTEARQAFNAVAITCKMLDEDLLNMHAVEVIDTDVGNGCINCRIHPAVDHGSI